MTDDQLNLFGATPSPPPALPPGLRYQPELITAAQEQALVAALADLDFQPFEFHGFLGHRRVASFGWRYDYARQALQAAAPLPDFLLSLRARLAAFTGHAPEAFQQVLINEYRPGAGIGWHRDKPHFADVAGVSLLSPCKFRLRVKAGASWRRASLTVAPRSAYLLSGPARTDWEHSIPPHDALRYSITFRTFRP